MKRLLALSLTLICLFLCSCGSIVPDLSEKQVKLPDMDCIENADNRYLIQQLSEDQLTNLCAMYEAVMDFEKSCSLPYPPVEGYVDCLVRLLQYECPELIQIDFTDTIYYTVEDNQVTQVEFSFRMDQEEYEKQMEACEEIAEEILEMAEQADDPELAIYDYITENCTYDADHKDAATIYGCLVKGYAKCDGISLSYKWLLEQMDMTCLCIAGDPPDGGIGHAWNVVEIDGEFYDVDVTADVNQEDQETDRLYGAYHVDRQWIRTKYIIDRNLKLFTSIPGSKSMDESYHAKAGNLLEQEEDPELEEKFLDAYEREGSFTLQFADVTDYRLFMDSLEEDIEKIAEDNKLNGWKYEYQTQEDYYVVTITVGKP